MSTEDGIMKILLLDIKQSKTSLQLTVPENLDDKEDPKRDIHGANLHKK